jgi:hypothetical protein
MDILYIKPSSDRWLVKYEGYWPIIKVFPPLAMDGFKPDKEVVRVP